MVEKAKKVITSDLYEEHLIEILQFGIDTFGLTQTQRYFEMISRVIKSLDLYYTYYPECRHLATKNKIYRNIILDAHLIIYRITNKRIEVLDILHAASSIQKIRSTRKTKL